MHNITNFLLAKNRKDKRTMITVGVVLATVCYSITLRCP